jgi:hypothetical protein
MKFGTFEYRYSCLSYLRFTHNDELASKLMIALVVFPSRPSGPANVWVCKDHLNLIAEIGGQADFDWTVNFLLDLEEKLVSCIFPEIAILALGIQLEIRDEVLQFSHPISISKELFESKDVQEELGASLELVPQGGMLRCIIQPEFPPEFSSVSATQ